MIHFSTAGLSRKTITDCIVVIATSGVVAARQVKKMPILNF